MHDDTDNRLGKLLKKEPTADNLNVIGDLYAKKGDIAMANHYFHKAISSLNFAQKNKIIAIYKKIIGHSPEDVRAYEGLLKILLRTGFVVDELKYLTVLARMYEEREDGEKAFFAYRRLYELNPDNLHARDYIEKWEKTHPGSVTESKPEDIQNAKTYVTASDEKVWERPADHPVAESSVEPEDVSPAASDTVIMDRASIGLFSVSLDESSGPVADELPPPKRTEFRTEFARPNLVPALIALAVFVIFVGAGAFWFSKYLKKGAVIEEKISPVALSFLTIKEKKSNGFDLSVAKVSGKSMTETELVKHFTQEELMENTFYSVTIQAREGCLPNSFVANPQHMVMIKGKGGESVEKGGEGRVSGMNRTVYRSNVCGRDFGAVFIRFFVYHNKAVKISEFSVSGLEQGLPVRIPWEE